MTPDHNFNVACCESNDLRDVTYFQRFDFSRIVQFALSYRLFVFSFI